mgnify:CR=1 FL=1
MCSSDLAFLTGGPAAPEDLPANMLRFGQGYVRPVLVQVDDGLPPGLALPEEIEGPLLVIDGLPKRCELCIENTIRPVANKAISGLYLSQGGFFTQCEAEGFRRICYFIDRPDIMSIFTVELRADSKRFPTLLSNGNCIAHSTLADGRHSAKWHDPFPKPSYLFALVAANLSFIQDTFTTISGRTVDLRLYARNDDLSQCHHALDSLKQAMRWDEEQYGREYDLDLYMVVAVKIGRAHV